MRIIGGNLKGKIISFLKSSTTRPLKDFVKENIFNILIHSNLGINLNNSNVLDLYSGVGSFGLECVSRGAKKITFVEKDIEAFKILNENINKLSVENKTIVIFDLIKNFLEKKQSKKFDIFFLDPPFLSNDFIKDLNLIKKNKIYNKNHIIIIHRERNSHDNFEKLIKVLVIKNYGRSKVIFAKF